jgi:hypothetical protein
MKRILVFVLAAATLAFPAAQANAASSAAPTAAQFRALQKQVKALQTQVKTLQKWVPASCSTKTCLTLPAVSGLADFTYTVNICQDAVIADEFQATWTVIDQIAAATQAGKTYFGAQTPIADKSACSLVQVTRPTIATTPTAAIFTSLVTLLTT